MKTALLFLVGLASLHARADFCSVCDSIRHSFGAQTIPVQYPQEPDDDSATEAGLPAYLLPRNPGRMRIEVAQLSPTPMIPPTTSATSALEKRAADLVNDRRRQVGLPQLLWDEQLNRAARDYASILDSLPPGVPISHVLDGDFGLRLSRYGVLRGANAENIARGQHSAEQVVNDWLSSPGHRSNLYDGRFRRHGIAEIRGSWVHIFSD